MKKLITITALIFAFGLSSLTAQNRQLQRETDRFVYSADIYDTRNIFDPEDPQSYDGTPYYKQSFLMGNIYFENELLDRNVPLRYNALNDEIEYKESATDSDKDAKALIKSKDLYVTIMGETFVFIPSKGYFLVLSDGNNFSFLKKITKKYFAPREPENSFDKGALAKFSDRFTYNIFTKEGVLKEFPKSKKKRLKVFGKSEKLVSKYIKEHKLDISDEKDLKKVIMHLDGVEGASL